MVVIGIVGGRSVPRHIVRRVAPRPRRHPTGAVPAKLSRKLLFIVLLGGFQITVPGLLLDSLRNGTHHVGRDVRRHVTVGLDVVQQHLMVWREVIWQRRQTLELQTVPDPTTRTTPMRSISRIINPARVLSGTSHRYPASISFELRDLAVATKALQFDGRHDPVIAIPLHVLQLFTGDDQRAMFDTTTRKPTNSRPVTTTSMATRAGRTTPRGGTAASGAGPRRNGAEVPRLRGRR